MQYNLEGKMTVPMGMFRHPPRTVYNCHTGSLNCTENAKHDSVFDFCFVNDMLFKYDAFKIAMSLPNEFVQ